MLWLLRVRREMECCLSREPPSGRNSHLFHLSHALRSLAQESDHQRDDKRPARVKSDIPTIIWNSLDSMKTALERKNLVKLSCTCLPAS